MSKKAKKEVETKEVETKEGETKEVETKEVETKEGETKEVETKEVETKEETKEVKTKEVEGRAKYEAKSKHAERRRKENAEIDFPEIPEEILNNRPYVTVTIKGGKRNGASVLFLVGKDDYNAALSLCEGKHLKAKSDVLLLVGFGGYEKTESVTQIRIAKALFPKLNTQSV